MANSGIGEPFVQFRSAPSRQAWPLPFEEYCRLSRQWLLETREVSNFQQMARVWGLSTSEVVDANAPFCLQPEGDKPARKAVLLLHGFMESPLVMRDLAAVLCDQGYAVYAPLLPGHGTQAQDLEGIRAKQWLNMALYAYQSMRMQHTRCYVGGVSLGTLLALQCAMHFDDIQGLFLISPALGSRSSLVKYAEWFNYFKGVLHPMTRWRYSLMQDYAKYASSPVHGIAAVMHMMRHTGRALARNPIRLPVWSMLSMDDETISPRAWLHFLASYAGDKRCLLYARKPSPAVCRMPYVHYRTSSHPEQGIVSQSHLGLQIAPDNPHYGQNGDITYYKHYGHRGLSMGKPCYQGSTLQWPEYKLPYARLQYNPDFAFAAQDLVDFLAYQAR